ncbi:Pyroglutamyl-peptidase 1-like protein [Myotis brandtii]|uniref:Pyroglutamyl-peptidase 1-like protein n=1 Tax=Myotis brandtii TaxID=109478 RepID=S7N5B1_MYOBR|nr:Pyroglutamyl-peptidase 1-like protein [Myotis brandtii]
MVTGLSFPKFPAAPLFAQLTVHVGVDAAAKAVVLEQRGRNRGYRETDVRGFRPENGVCVPDGPEVIESRVNMKAVSRHAAVEGVEVMFSRDAGRYVCDYTYYLSLHLGNGRAALIHVPPLSPGLPTSLLGKVLQVVIQEMLAEGENAQGQSLVPTKQASVVSARENQPGRCCPFGEKGMRQSCVESSAVLGEAF